MNNFEYLLEEADAEKAKFVSKFVHEWIQLKQYVADNPIHDIQTKKYNADLYPQDDRKSSKKIFIENDEWFQITADRFAEHTKYWLVSNIEKLYDFYSSLTTSKRFEKRKNNFARNILGGTIPLVDLEHYMEKLYLSPKQFAEKIYDTYVSLEYLF